MNFLKHQSTASLENITQKRKGYLFLIIFCHIYPGFASEC